jgi:hypothetical protein
MAEPIYPKGLRGFAKHQNAPDFVLGTLIITPKELFDWIKENPQHLTEYKDTKQIRIQILKSKKDGSPSFQIDTWKKEADSDNPPTPKTEPEYDPFA